MTDDKGVQFIPPPTDRLGPIMRAVHTAVDSLPEGANGAIVGLVNEAGANAAVVAKLDQQWVVTGWVGKKWGGSLEYGAAVRKTW